MSEGTVFVSKRAATTHAERRSVVVVERSVPSVVIAPSQRPGPVVVLSRPSTLVAERPRTQVVFAGRERASMVIAAGKQGPRGVPGPAGGSSLDETYIAQGSVNGHRASVRLPDGRVAHYDPADPTHHGAVIGLSTNAAADGDPVVVKLLGRLDFNGWNWTPGLPIFARADGTLSHTPGAVALQVAEATSATGLLVRVFPPIFLS